MRASVKPPGPAPMMAIRGVLFVVIVKGSSIGCILIFQLKNCTVFKLNTVQFTLFGTTMSSVMKIRREQIMDMAMSLLDRDGLEGVTLRKVAAALHVHAGALYWHVHNKQELL